ncbi:MAG TPA: hypothetical protein VEB86_12545 [Chryseosolibacter sp.]|nr:hypothetical protein [Chryseosolibacter sp.]
MNPNFATHRKTFCRAARIGRLRSHVMTSRIYFSGVALSCAVALLLGCAEKQDSPPSAYFTKADSLTERYLALEDSILEAWNMMINDDNQKIEAMHNLLHELMVSRATDQELLNSYESRLMRLKNLRYTQKSMANPDVVTEYDFASNALVSELIALAESQKQFAYNTTLQKLVEIIRTSDERVYQYRETYDMITARYNQFVNDNRDMLKEMKSDSVENRPLFQVAEN